MPRFIIDIGDRVLLREQSILDLGGGFRVTGPDSGRVIDISVGMDLVAIEWDRARFRGWYDVDNLYGVVKRVIVPPRPSRLSQTEMLRFPSIQDLLARLGFEEDQDHACLRPPRHGHVVEFERFSGQSLASFVAQELCDGWLRDYLCGSAESE